MRSQSDKKFYYEKMFNYLKHFTPVGGHCVFQHLETYTAISELYATRVIFKW